MQIVIIGAGHAAAQCVLNLKRENVEATITVVGDEPYLPYLRPPLSKAFLQGQQDVEQLLIKPQNYYDDNDVSFIQDTCKAIDTEQQTISLASGKQIAFDKLVMATGSQLRKLNLPGADLAGIHYLKTINDANAIKAQFATAKRLLVCGGGYIGLEVAASAKQAGLEVTVLEMGDRIMQRVVSPQTSDYFHRLHTEHGVNILCNKTVNQFVGDKKITAVCCDDGTKYDADIVIVGIGVIPETALAENGGLTVDNGIVVNEYCQTSQQAIYAIGDCANHHNAIYDKRLRLECVQNANGQAKTVAAHIADKLQPYNEVPWFWSDQYDCKLQIAGLLDGYDELLVRGDSEGQSAYSVLAFKNKKLIAVEAVKKPKDFMHGKGLIAKQLKLTVTDLKDDSIELNSF